MYYFHEHYYLWLFCFYLENVGECCKAQRVCVPQRIALYKSYLLLLLSAYLRGSTSGHLFTQSTVLFKWSVPYFRSDGNQSFTPFQVVLKHNSSGQCIQRILAVSMVTNQFLYCVVLSRRHNCIFLLLFKSWQVITYACSSQNWRIWFFPLPQFHDAPHLLLTSVSTPRNCHFILLFVGFSLSGSCSLAITYSSCTFSLSSELSSSIVEGGFGCVTGLSNKAKFVSITCVEEMSSLLCLTGCLWASSCCCLVIARRASRLSSLGNGDFLRYRASHRFALVGPGNGCHVVTVPSEDQSCCFSLTVDIPWRKMAFCYQGFKHRLKSKRKASFIHLLLW